MPSPESIIKAVRRFNRWRRGARTRMSDPAKIGRDLDALCDLAERQKAELKQLRSQLSTPNSKPSR